MSVEPDIEIYMKAFRADPEGYETNRDLGLAMLGANAFVLHAEEHILKALSFNRDGPERERLFHALAMVSEYKGDYDRAIGILTQLFGLRSNSLNYLPELGEAYFNAGRMAEASDVYRIVLGVHHERAVEAAACRSGPPIQLIFPFKVICTRFGEMAEKLDFYVKARILGYTPEVSAVLLAPPDLVLNPCLMDYWRKSVGRTVTVVSDPVEIREFEREYIAHPLFVDWLAFPDGRVLNRLPAYCRVQRQWEDEGRAPLLRLTEAHRRRGRETLEALGMPADAWFVSLHVRGSGYHQEAAMWDHNAYRNAPIEDYVAAIEAITARGGWVVRLGDPSMKPLPAMEQVIDYVHTEVRSDWMDVFLCAGARFFIGTCSGPFAVAFVFGVPVIGTNWFPMAYWTYSTRDIMVHKLLRRVDDGRFLNIRESSRPPLPGMHWPQYFEDHGLEVVDNSPEDIRGAVTEMLDRFDGTLEYSVADEDRQRCYKSMMNFCDFEGNARISADFLRRRGFLVEETLK